MKQGKPPEIILTDGAGNVLFKNKLTALPVKEEAVIAGTVKYYDDPDPCVVRRSAVMKTCYMELETIIREGGDFSVPRRIEALPEPFGSIDFPAGAVSFCARIS